MSFFAGAGLWMGVGLVLMLWMTDADRKWQELLTTHGLLPEGPDKPFSAALHLVSFFRRRWAYLSVAYPRTLRTSDSELETWRLRRSRRIRLFVAWMFGGLIFAILTMVTIDGAHENSWWFAALVPIAAVLGYLIRFGYLYGSAGVDEVSVSEP